MKHRETVPVREPIEIVSQLVKAGSHAVAEESIKVVDSLQLEEVLGPAMFGVGDRVL